MGPAMLIWPDLILVGARARTAAKSLRSEMLCEARDSAKRLAKATTGTSGARGRRCRVPTWKSSSQHALLSRLASSRQTFCIVCSVPRSLVLSRTGSSRGIEDLVALRMQRMSFRVWSRLSVPPAGALFQINRGDSRVMTTAMWRAPKPLSRRRNVARLRGSPGASFKKPAQPSKELRNTLF